MREGSTVLLHTNTSRTGKMRDNYAETSFLPLDIFHHGVLSRELIMVGKVVDDLKIVHPKMLALF
jgi:hypothetical protein